MCVRLQTIDRSSGFWVRPGVCPQTWSTTSPALSVHSVCIRSVKHTKIDQTETLIKLFQLQHEIKPVPAESRCSEGEQVGQVDMQRPSSVSSLSHWTPQLCSQVPTRRLWVVHYCYTGCTGLWSRGSPPSPCCRRVEGPPSWPWRH